MRNNSYVEGKVMSADPVELIQILYDEALASLRQARTHLAEGRVRERSSAIDKAMSIVTELAASLDMRAGGQISRNLAQLYAYILDRLADGNFSQSDPPLAEVQSLLTTLADGWKCAARPAAKQPAALAAPSGLRLVPEGLAARFCQPAAAYAEAGWSA